MNPATDLPISHIEDVLAIARGQRSRDHRSLLILTPFHLVYCPALNHQAAERTELGAKLARSSFARVGESMAELQGIPSPLHEWLRHLEPNQPVYMFPLIELSDIEWRGDRRLLVRIGGKQYQLLCSSVFEAEREFDLLRSDAMGHLTEAALPRTGWPHGLGPLLAGVAVLGAVLLVDFTLVAGGAPPPAGMPEALQQLYIEVSAPERLQWAYRLAALAGAALSAWGLRRLVAGWQTRNLVLKNSAMPMMRE
jgi:hypothetical protein